MCGDVKALTGRCSHVPEKKKAKENPHLESRARGLGESIAGSRSKGGSVFCSRFLSLTLFKDSSPLLVSWSSFIIIFHQNIHMRL